ncbi:PKD domain-containing protein [Pseudoalteromonas rhizosphaerae]|uniref:PKD domain-containing protein n=1 Tax=Pseudoalteromonas rhizosphaerae TaxID=2518973 RepID=UPI003850CBFA
MNLIKSMLAASISLALLSGCESDFVDHPDEPINTAPVISVSDTAVVEKQAISISATVQDEGPVTYLWSQNAGLSVALENTNTGTVSFIAPSVSEDKKISLNLTVTDSEGLTSEKNVVVDIQQQLVKLSLEGIATDSPLIDAAIKAKIGSQEFTTTTNSDGYYSLELALDDDADMSQLVTIEAQGKEQQQAALLQSRLMSFASLKTKAGDDAVLTNDEDFSVNITNLTTAKSALLARENLFVDIKSEQDLKRLSNEISADELVKVATTIKVILDKSTSNELFALPEGVNNVLELALDNEKMTQYIKKVEQTPEFSQAQEEMLADEKVVQSTKSNNIKTFYYNRGNLSINQVIELDNDGTGRYLLQNYDGRFDWIYQNDVYTLNNPEGFYAYQTTADIEIDGETKRVRQEVTTYKAELKLIAATENGFLVKETEYKNVEYPDGELENYQLTNESILKVFTQNEQVDFTFAQTQNPIALPAPHIFVDQVSLGAITLMLNDDGTGAVSELGNTPITWRMIEDNNKQSLHITLSDYDNETILFRQLTSDGDIATFAAFSEFDGIKNASVGTGSIIDESETFNIATIPGIYSYNFDGKSLDEFWFELWPDGKAISMSVYDSNEDGQLSVAESRIYAGNWHLDDDILTITRNLNGRDDCYYVEQDPNCWLWNTRQWKLIEQIEDTIYVNNMHQFTYSQGEEPREKTFDNRKFNRATERPISSPLPDEILQQIGYQPPVSLTGLISPNNYLGKRLYFTDHDYKVEGELGYFQFDDNNSFQYYQDNNLSTGTYQIFSDNQLILRDGSSLMYGANYSLLIGSSNVVIATFKEHIWPHFTSENDAKEYMSIVADNKPVSNVEHLIGRDIYMVDRDRDDQWVVSYLKFDEDKITIYSDESFTTINTELDYSVDDTGMISFPDDQNTMYLSLVTDEFNIIITNDVGNSSKDFNYFLFDQQKAKDFVNNTNALRESAQR